MIGQSFSDNKQTPYHYTLERQKCHNKHIVLIQFNGEKRKGDLNFLHHPAL
ncbi:protein of unknown function [Maridesulfovibrio hydrothermalis AM13 = DSM 14728]|uniref:Uncharacterized protein n=1 Tax=Maridesulfovibrio hydrothermalis AM13 = DSM 14728 TaxID=1121451 RepID=L0RGY4_9BACT|nr:protein of unknown function [Maridesulfovibrio hydrothermalis AM13 = DSM 14728]